MPFATLALCTNAFAAPPSDASLARWLDTQNFDRDIEKNMIEGFNAGFKPYADKALAEMPEAGRALLAAHPDIGLIVADDGLQHYALRRDVEIAVFPAADTGRTDLDLLPNGSLREPLLRLDSVDAVVVSGGKADALFRPSENMFHSRIEAGRIYRLNNPSEILDTGRLKNQTVVAVAGIAKPARFFDSLRNMGITVKRTVALPDHADISAADLPDADAVIITEKDAVKFSDGICTDNVWVLPVCAIIEPDLAAFVLERLEDVPKAV